jgi:hypothetical protein
MSRKKGGMEADKTKEKVTQEVKDVGKPGTTEEVRAEVTEGVSGSADGSNEPPESAPTNQPSSDLPAIPFQAETFLPATLLPASLPPELESGWVAPVNWGLEEWVERSEKLGYWADGISRLDALVIKRHGEALWHSRDCFRQKKESIKAEGKKLKDEKLTWTKLLDMRKWDRATVSRRIKFYWKHRNTPDDQLDGQTVCKMWSEDQEYMRDPPALGQFFRLKSSRREVVSEKLGKTDSTQAILEEGTIIEVAGFNDGQSSSMVMRITSQSMVQKSKALSASGII